jgi:hypothetical protein
MLFIMFQMGLAGKGAVCGIDGRYSTKKIKIKIKNWY